MHELLRPEVYVSEQMKKMISPQLKASGYGIANEYHDDTRPTLRENSWALVSRARALVFGASEQSYEAGYLAGIAETVRIPQIRVKNSDKWAAALADAVPLNEQRAPYLAFEGLNSCGKGSQLGLLEEKLREGGIPFWRCREPGSTYVGEELRKLLQMQQEETPTVRAETAMLMAQRAQLLEREIVPRIGKGTWVLSDRSMGTSLAFQGIGRDLGISQIAALNAFAVDRIRPDMTIYLRTHPEDIRDRQKDGVAIDRFEGEGDYFEKKCFQGYEEVLRRESQMIRPRWVGIDANRAIDEVAEDVWRVVESVRNDWPTI